MSQICNLLPCQRIPANKTQTRLEGKNRTLLSKQAQGSCHRHIRLQGGTSVISGHLNSHVQFPALQGSRNIIVCQPHGAAAPLFERRLHCRLHLLIPAPGCTDIYIYVDMPIMGPPDSQQTSSRQRLTYEQKCKHGQMHAEEATSSSASVLQKMHALARTIVNNERAASTQWPAQKNSQIGGNTRSG